MKVLILGDHLANGSGIAAPDKAFPELIGDILGATIVNSSVNWETTEDLFQRARGVLEANADADSIFIVTGQKDIYDFADRQYQTTVANLVLVAELARTLVPAAQIKVANVALNEPGQWDDVYGVQGMLPLMMSLSLADAEVVDILHRLIVEPASYASLFNNAWELTAVGHQVVAKALTGDYTLIT